MKPWFRVGFYDGSGDDNPTDKTHGTFFQVLPTPRPYARFPFFDMINNRDIFASLVLRPHAKWTISNEYHFLSLAQRITLASLTIQDIALGSPPASVGAVPATGPA